MIERLGFLFAGIRKYKGLTYYDITKEIPALSPQVLEMWENGDNTKIKLHEILCLMDLFDIGLEITVGQKNESQSYYEKHILPRIPTGVVSTEFFIDYEVKKIMELVVFVRDNTPYLMTATKHVPSSSQEDLYEAFTYKVEIEKKP